MARIVPTINVSTVEEYKARLEQVAPFAKRIHVDITDGQFAPSKTINLAQVYAPEGVELDLHLMMDDPAAHLVSALALKPSLIIIHAECQSDKLAVIGEIKSLGVHAGVALMADTQPAACQDLLHVADHALVFTGHLGYNHGTLDTDQLPKLEQIKNINNSIETSVDGGITRDNAAMVAAAGADVLAVGAAIAEARDAQQVFNELSEQARDHTTA